MRIFKNTHHPLFWKILVLQCIVSVFFCGNSFCIYSYWAIFVELIFLSTMYQYIAMITIYAGTLSLVYYSHKKHASKLQTSANLQDLQNGIRSALLCAPHLDDCFPPPAPRCAVVVGHRQKPASHRHPEGPIRSIPLVNANGQLPTMPPGVSGLWPGTIVGAWKRHMPS